MLLYLFCNKSHYENVPFEIPESWVLSDFSELVTLLSGRDLESNDCNSNREGIPYLIGASNIVDGKINITRWTTKPLVISKRGDILISCKGTIGEVVTNVIGEIHIARQFMAIQTLPMVYADYIELYIKSIVNNIKRNARGVIPGISREDILQREIALPPLEEQKRIVIEVEKWLDYIADIEAEKNELESHIKKTKSTILDLAISGKLVPQDPDDEPAIELLKRINPGFEPCDNSHYENLPQGWTVCKIKDIFNITMGQSPTGESINGVKGIEFHQGKIHFTESYLSQSGVYTDQPTKIAEVDSLLLCVRAPVGVLNITQRKICIGRGLCALKPKYEIDNLYWLFILTAYKDYFESNATGSTFKAISGDTIKNAVIKLPPLQEQKRILSSIISLYESLDAITAEL